MARAARAMAPKRGTKEATPSRPSAAAARQGRPALFAALLGAVFAAGAASLVYEVVWIRQLGFSLGSTAVAFSVMLSAFLGGLALGGWWMGRRSDALAAPARTLAVVEVAAGALGVMAVPVLAVVGRAYVYASVALSVTPAVSLALRSLVALAVMLVPATLFGMTFPLTTVIGGKLARSGHTAAAAVSAASSFGSAAGALLCGLWFEPAFGLFASAAIGAGLNLLAAAAAFAIGRRTA